MSRKLARIKWNKDGDICAFGWTESAKYRANQDRIFWDSHLLYEIAIKFIKGLIERHYPCNFDDASEIILNSIDLDYAFDEIKSLRFSLNVIDEESGAMTFSLPSLPLQILSRDADLIEVFSNKAIEIWDEYQALKPNQTEILFAMPDLETYEQIEVKVNKSLGVE